MGISGIISAAWRRRLGPTLIVIQVVLTIIVFANAVGVIETHLARMSRPSGLDEPRVFSFQNRWIGGSKEYSDLAASDLAQLRATTGVLDATISNGVPLSGRGFSTGVDSRPVQQGAGPAAQRAATYYLDDRGVAALGLQMSAGRWFNSGEVETTSLGPDAGVAPVAVISRDLADRLYPDGDAIGKLLYTASGSSLVIGIVQRLQSANTNASNGDTADLSLVYPGRLALPTVSFIVRTNTDDVSAVMKRAEQALRTSYSARIITELRSFQETRYDNYRPNRAVAVILVTVSSLLLVTTSLGIAGLTAYWVSSRTRQIGIQRALGARRLDVLKHFLTENVIIVGSGTALGALLAVLINAFLAQQMQMPILDLPMLLLGCALVVTVGQVAAWLPARRAMSIPPAIATRSA